MMSGNVEGDPNIAVTSDEVQHPPTGGNTSLNGTAKTEIDIKPTNNSGRTTNGDTVPESNESNAKETTNNLYNRSSQKPTTTSLTQSNWVKFDGDESSKDSKVL